MKHLALLILVAPTAYAEEPVETTLHVLSYEDIRVANADCTVRAKNEDRNTARSAMPSCYKGDIHECTIIVRRPKKGGDDYAAYMQMGREWGNCVNGHQFPVNPK